MSEIIILSRKKLEDKSIKELKRYAKKLRRGGYKVRKYKNLEDRNKIIEIIISGIKNGLGSGKSSTRKSSTRKSSTRKSPTSKSSTRKSSTRKSSTRKSSTRKSSTRKPKRRKSSTRKSPRRKSSTNNNHVTGIFRNKTECMKLKAEELKKIAKEYGVVYRRKEQACKELMNLQNKSVKTRKKSSSRRSHSKTPPPVPQRPSSRRSRSKTPPPVPQRPSSRRSRSKTPPPVPQRPSKSRVRKLTKKVSRKRSKSRKLQEGTEITDLKSILADIMEGKNSNSELSKIQKEIFLCMGLISA